MYILGLVLSSVILTISGAGLYQVSVMRENILHLPQNTDASVFAEYARL